MLKAIFDQFLYAKPVFGKPEALTASFTPENIPHREKQITELGRMLGPVLRGAKPSNIFIYGKTGTGKTLVVQYVTSELERMASDKIKVIYINCKLRRSADTEYRMLVQIAHQLGKNLPFTGLPTETVYHAVFELMEQQAKIILLVLDEVDALVQKMGDELLYTLTRINSELKRSKLSIIGVTNDLSFIEKLDARIRSSLGEEEIVFPPYNAVQLQDILRERIKLAAACVEPGVIEKCAALAAQEHGDARRALELLRVAGELAERAGQESIRLEHVDAAQEKIDQDKVIEIVKAQPRQSQAILRAIIELSAQKRVIETSDVINKYSKICSEYGLRPLTNRRISDLIAEFDMFGIIQAQIISKGRYGRTRVLSLALSEQLRQKVKKVLDQVFYI